MVVVSELPPSGIEDVGAFQVENPAAAQMKSEVADRLERMIEVLQRVIAVYHVNGGGIQAGACVRLGPDVHALCSGVVAGALARLYPYPDPALTLED